MKNTPFILLILGVAFVWLGLTGRLGAVLAAIFEPQNLQQGGSGYVPPSARPGAPQFSTIPGSSITVPNDPYFGTGGIVQ